MSAERGELFSIVQPMTFYHRLVKVLYVSWYLFLFQYLFYFFYNLRSLYITGI